LAEITNVSLPAKNEKPLFVKKTTRVDLTPMVDLGFLLITVFVFTTTLSLPTVMNLNMPFDKVPPGDEVCESCALTILLGKGNVIKYYEGKLESNPVVNETSFGNDGNRNIIFKKRKAVQALRGSAVDFVMIIKPSNESTFENFVDIVDEVAINNVKHYYITEIDKNN
jgi:biopolymer transport protein ExbD